MADLCVDCPAGTYNNATGQAHCVSCPVNTHNPSTGSSLMSCSHCRSGYEAKAGSSICCPRGAYVLVTSASMSCQPCPIGYFADPTNDNGCTACAAGMTADPFDYECRNCPAGKYSERGSGCLSCPAGKYSLEGNATCMDCPTGEFSKEGSSKCSSCAS